MLSLIEPGDRCVPGELKKGVCAMTVQRHRAVIETDYHQFLIEAGPPRELIHGRYPELPLAIVAEDTISVKVGIKARPVNIAVELHTRQRYSTTPNGRMSPKAISSPPQTTLSTCSRSGTTNPRHPASATSPRPGNHRYRVRICARGRDIRFDDYLDGDPAEDYLIQMWPTTNVEAPRQIKHTSGR